MARHTEHDTSKIYQAANAFRANCLLRDCLLLIDDPTAWNPVVLDRLPKTFVASTDEDSGFFIAKLSYRISRTGGKAPSSFAPRPV